MAEVAIGAVKDNLISLLVAEASLLKDVDNEVKKIASQLDIIHSFLKGVDKRAEGEGENVRGGVKAWAQELREVAFQIEDIVTEYTHHMAEEPPDCNDGESGECLQAISSFLLFCCSRLVKTHVLPLQIRRIKARLNAVHERGDTRGIINSIQQGSTSTTADPSYDPRDFSRDIKEDELVGIEPARGELVHALLHDSSPFTIIPVVGMGGMGKTTLTQKVYDHVKGKFQSHAWVEVPRPYTREEILRNLIMELCQSTKTSVPGEIHTMSEAQLKEKLREYLQGKKYLIIFDDVWKEDFWGDIGHALIDDKVGGRIMITTRHMEVAEFCGGFCHVHIQEMQFLSKEMAWKLFCKKTFRKEGCCPKELEKISRDIVERCEGLPLAIVVIAGLLSTKNKIVSEWRRFDASLNSELQNNAHLKSITKILSLSYYELPYYLKSCLLYFGMFPRHHSIRNGRLIRQWIAEGFIKPEKGKTLEVVAQEHMNKLINRSLVEATELDVTGKPKECRVHDLLHEIILNKTKEVRFCQVLSGHSDHSRLGGTTRRLSIMDNSSNDVLRGIAFSHRSAFSHVHSVVIFSEHGTLNHFVPIFAINFKFIKVLDFEDAPSLHHLPEDIGSLFDLTYLSVRGTKVSVLPRSIQKLRNLETLYLEESSVYEIPAFMICKLRKLRHLFCSRSQADAPFGFVGMKLVGGIGGLRALQKIDSIEVDHEGVDGLFIELGNLVQLRSLAISKLRSGDVSTLCRCIEKLEVLESLTIRSISAEEVIDLECMSPPQFLERLTLFGRLRKWPRWFTEYQNLLKLRLDYSMLEDDPLDFLKNMRNLLELTMSNDAYVGKNLCFKEGVLPKLKSLDLVHLNSLCSLTIEGTALPMLEQLYIGPFPQMKALPSGLQHLRKLKTLVFHSMPIKFVMLQGFQTVCHVPQVGFLFKHDEGQQEWVPLPDLLRRQQDWMQKNQKDQEGASTSGSAREQSSGNKSRATDQAKGHPPTKIKKRLHILRLQNSYRGATRQASKRLLNKHPGN